MTLRLITLVVKEMMAGTKPSLYPLAQLEHVVLRAPITGVPPGYNMVFVAPFFYLPKLEFLATTGLGIQRSHLRDVHDDEPCWVEGDRQHVALNPDLYISRFPVGTSPIETLVLNRACFYNSGLLVLVRACRVLKKLVLNVSHSGRVIIAVTTGDLEHNDRVVAKLEDLSKAIAYHSSSLEEVTFDIRNELDWADYRHYHKTTAPLALYDCLKNMQRLKRLTIHIEFLYRKATPIVWATKVELVIDRLPPTLEHLVLKRHYAVDATVLDGEMRHYRTILDDCRPDGHLPKLKSLDVPLCYERSREFRFFEDAEELETLAASIGVQIIFREHPTDWSVPQVPEPYPPLQYCRELSDSTGLTLS